MDEIHLPEFIELAFFQLGTKSWAWKATDENVLETRKLPIIAGSQSDISSQLFYTISNEEKKKKRIVEQQII